MQTQNRTNIPQVAQNLVVLGFVLFIATTSLSAQNFHKHSSRTQYQKSFFSFLFPTVKGSGNVISNERTVKPFHAIVVENPSHAFIKQGSPYFAALTVGIASNTTVEAPLTLPHLTTNAGITCNITFEGGTIGKHHINADGKGLGVNIKALPDSTSYKTTTKRVQQPLPLAPKN